jgi:hypothetical protein
MSHSCSGTEEAERVSQLNTLPRFRIFQYIPYPPTYAPTQMTHLL